MKQILKQILKIMHLYYPLRNWGTRRKQEEELSKWYKRGKQGPPPHIIKQRTLLTYAREFELKILVETGTHYGDMVEAMKNYFDRIYSIELSNELFEEAKERFNKEVHIEIIHGDSGIEIGNIIDRINHSSIFWLDGHYSGGVTAKGNKDTPIFDELDHILNATDFGHVIIIDDARLFGTDPAYPSIYELTNFIKAKKPDVTIEVQDDSIRITPNTTTG